MAMVDVDDVLYSKIKKIVEKQRIDYPTLQNFINKAIKEKIETIKGG